MPAVFKTGDLTEGGLRGIKKFAGVFDSFEDDIEGEYGTQVSFHWTDATVLESTDPIVLEDGHFTTWAKQSNKKNSTYGKVLKDWESFAAANKFELGERFAGFKGKNIVYQQKTYEFGKDATPGKGYVPVAFYDGPVAAKPAAAAPANLQDKVKEIVGAAGAEREAIRRELLKAGLRNAVSEQGGVEKVLETMVASKTIAVDAEGKYILAG